MSLDRPSLDADPVLHAMTLTAAADAIAAGALTARALADAQLARVAATLPLGMRLAAPAGEDDRLLAVAAWCEARLPFKGLV